MSRMKAFHGDIARPICLVLFPISDESYALCNVANDGWLNFNGLGTNMVSIRICESRWRNTSTASAMAASH